jgi:hypothetical protein
VLQILAVRSHSRTSLQNESVNVVYKKMIAVSCDICIKTNQLDEESSAFSVVVTVGCIHDYHSSSKR